MPKRRADSTGQKTLSKVKPCPHCDRPLWPQGYKGHVTACLEKQTVMEASIRYCAMLEARDRKKVRVLDSSAAPDDTTSRQPSTSGNPSIQGEPPAVNGHDNPTVAFGPPADEEPEEPARSHKNDIRIEHHPNSNHSPLIQPLEEHIHNAPQSSNHSPPPQPEYSDEPRRPFFKTREDFLFAEIMHESNFTPQQVDCLIEIMNACTHGNGKFTLSSHEDVVARWKRSGRRLPTPSPETD
ncbi:hypothetical protein BC834DRAFT_864154 [Gloeopeniophorella convolvens]|nr:hypothetical protein BC834DRAFT_864154 [Gloeopeniophorella convolvens]